MNKQDFELGKPLAAWECIGANRSTKGMRIVDFLVKVAGAPGLEPGTYGFGDRRSTN